jgi:ketosteroid isomerase-like protein
MEQELIQMERTLEDALIRGDVDKLAQILADDLTHANPCGALRGKTPWIAAVGAGQIKFQSCSKEDLQVRIYGETAVVTAINVLRARAAGADPTGHYRLIHVWVKRDGRWRLAAHQTTRITARSERH